MEIVADSLTTGTHQPNLMKVDRESEGSKTSGSEKPHEYI